MFSDNDAHCRVVYTCLTPSSMVYRWQVLIQADLRTHTPQSEAGTSLPEGPGQGLKQVVAR